MSRANTNGSTITDLVGVSPLRRLDGGAVAVWSFPECGVETFKAGEMVCLSGSTGNAIGITKPPTDASGYGILGFAADDASGSVSSWKGVYVATPETVFVGNVGHSTSALAQTAALDVGQKYGLTSLSGRTYVDKSKTACSTAMVRVLGVHNADSVPCFYGKVYFQVLNPFCQLQNAWNTNSSSNSELVV